MSPEDFQVRSFVPNSGWPINFKEMIPHYRRALETCGFEGLESDTWFEKPDSATEDVYNEDAFLAPLDDFSDGWAEIREADPKNLILLYNSTVTEILTRSSGDVVSGVEVSNGNQKFHVNTKILVLATGGIENARILLLSDRIHSNGIGNDHDFMEHPRFRWGHIETVGSSADIVNLDPSKINRHGKDLPADLKMRLAKGLVLSRQLREREQLLASRTWLQPVPKGGEGDGAKNLRALGFWIAKGRRPPYMRKTLSNIARHPLDSTRALYFHKGPEARRLNVHSFCFNSIFEQAPQRDSRVTLSKHTDALRRRKVALDWRIDPLTWRTVSRTQSILADHIRGHGHKVDFDQWDVETRSAPSADWVRHHMGTTRMGLSPSQGVVDSECRVHGMRNLFVAGTSVFTTGGNDMITLTAIALAHRLADKLKYMVGSN